MEKIILQHADYDVVFDFEKIQNEQLRDEMVSGVKKFFKPFRLKETVDNLLVTFYFTDAIQSHFDSSGKVVQSENAKINHRQAFMQGHANTFAYTFDQGKIIEIHYSVFMPKQNKMLSRFKSRDFSSLVERQINTFYTRGFLTGLQLCNLDMGLSFIHACSFSKDNKATLIAATPGAGKSSMLLSIANQEPIQYSFIADDISLIDKGGHVHYVGRPMAIKSHHLQYFDNLKHKLSAMSKLQKFQWFVLKNRGLKYMAPPQLLFGAKVESRVPLNRAIYLTNSNGTEIEVETITNKEFAKLNANMLFSELMLGFEIVNRFTVLPSLQVRHFDIVEILTKTENNIAQAVEKCECLLVKVPFRSDPRLVFEFLKEKEII